MKRRTPSLSPMPVATPAPLRLHIDTLALPAMPRARGERVGVALQAELARLMSQPAMQQQLREMAQASVLSSREALDAGRLKIARGERPERTGRRLAQQLAQSLLAPSRGGRR